MLLTLLEWVWYAAELYALTVLLICLFVPSVFRTSNWRKALWILLKQGKPLPFLGFLAVSVFSMITRTLCFLDTLLFPGLKDVEKEFFEQPGKLIFVLGHPRSGTTNIQNAISSIDNCFTGTLADVICISLVQKYMLQPFVSAVNFIL